MKKGKENDCKNLNINFLGARDQAFTQHKEGRVQVHCEEKCCWSERLFQPSNWRKTSFFFAILISQSNFFHSSFPCKHQSWKREKIIDFMLDVLYGLVVYPEFNVKVTNLSVGLNSAETFHLNLPFSHISPKSATFSNSGVHVRRTRRKPWLCRERRK